MEKSLSLERFGINPFSILDEVFQKYPHLPDKVVNIAYDREADVLYVDFTLEEKTNDSEPLDDQGMIIVGLDSRGEKTGLTIMNASQH